MRLCRCFAGFLIAPLIGITLLLPAFSSPLFAQWVRPGLSSAGGGTAPSAADLLEDSREAGLLTDWHLDGHYGRHRSDFARHFAPERAAARLAASAKHQDTLHYELIFADGTFALTPSMAAFKGVYYAQSSTYLTSGGDWNVYLESGAEAVVFIDGKPVIESGPKVEGTLRGTIHADGGYHDVMVKFVAQAAPFRVAILPPNSGSRRKNNTPYLQASPASEDMMAGLHPGERLVASN